MQEVVDYTDTCGFKKKYWTFRNINTIACTIIPQSFCITLGSSVEGVVVAGQVVSSDSLGIELQVIEVLKGEESRDIIRIWNGTDFDCNGPWSLAASTIGEVGDSVVIILPLITEEENSWDVLGDYRRPDPYDNTPELSLENGAVHGFILGDALAPPEFNLLTFDYAAFKENIVETGDCSAIILDSDEPSTTLSATINNPFTSTLSILLEEHMPIWQVRLLSFTGELVTVATVHNTNLVELQTANLPAGMYVLELKKDMSVAERVKVLKL